MGQRRRGVQPMRRHVQLPRQCLETLAPHQPLHRDQLPLRGEALASTGLGPAAVSVWSARRRGRGLRRARLQLVLVVHVLPPVPTEK